MNFVQNLQYIFTLVGAVGSFVLGWIVLIKDSKKYQNICFFTFTAGLLLWSSFVFIHNFTGSLFWGRLIFIPVPLVIFSLWLFSYHFPVSGKFFLKSFFQKFIVIIGFPFLTVFGITPFVLENVIVEKEQLTPIKGPFMDVYYVFFLCFILVSIFNLIYKYLNSAKEERLKVQYFLLGLIGTLLLLVLFLVILPAVSGSYQSAFTAPALIVIMVVTTAYSILKKRLWSVQYIIGEIIFYFCVSVFGILVYRIAMLIHDLYLREMDVFLKLSIELMMGLTLGPVFLFLVGKTKVILSKNFSFRNWNYKQILNNINKITENEVDLKILSETISIYLLKHLEIKELGFILWEENGKSILYSHGFAEKNTKRFINEVNCLSKLILIIEQSFSTENVVLVEELISFAKDEDSLNLLMFLKECGITLLLRLTLQNDSCGFVFLGSKSNDDAFTREDYDFMASLVSILNLSFSRALLYGEIMTFNTRLQEEISEATYDLEKANEELRELDKAKDDLISIASHELRTPATIVKGKLHLLKKRVEKLKYCEGYDERIDRDIEVCLSAIEREIEQVNTLLEASRIGKDTMVLERQMMDLTDVIEQSVEDFREIAESKGLELKFEENKRELPFVNIDVRRIREVIDNLITNAIKYTNKGNIKIKVFQKNAREISVRVKDTGIGIPKEKRDKLFTKFYRVRDDEKGRADLVKPGGTGLGLYVAKNIVEKHGGRIEVESEENKGSIFTFHLPVGSKR